MKKMIFSALLALCSIASAKTYYVAPTGGKDSNPGTLTQPWATWQKGFATADAGDTVYFRGGIYYPTTYSYNQSVVYISQGYTGNPVVGHTGTAANPICYYAYPPDYAAGNFPILDCKYINTGRPSQDEQKYTQAIIMMQVNYIHIKGLHVRNLYQRYSNVMCQAIYSIANSNMIFENMSVHDIGGRAIVSFHDLSYTTAHFPSITTDTTRFINCDVYNMCDSLDPDPSYQYEDPRTSYVAGLGDGFKLQHTYGGCIRLTGCRMWHFSDDGVDFNGTGLFIVENTWISRGGDFSFTNEDGTYGGQEGNGIKYGALVGNVNTVSRIIRNCITAHNGGIGYDENNSRTYYYNIHSEIYNNISYHNRIGFGNFSQNSTDLPYLNTYYNNISFMDEHYPRGDEDGDIVEAYNNWVAAPGYGCYAWNVNGIPPVERIQIRPDDFVSLDTTQLYLPRKSDGSLPDITFLKLAANSDAIDAGVDVGLPYYGKAPDIGYSEYVAGSVTPPSPVYVSSIIENATPSRLEMTFNLTLANIVPATSAFTVMVNSSARSVSAVAISGTKVLLTLASPVIYGDAVTVAYTKPASNPLQTLTGGQAASLTAQSVTNNVAAVNPVYVSSVIENASPSRLEMTFNLTLANIVPATSAFTVMVNSSARSVSAVAISGTKVLLTLASPVIYGDAVTVAYTKPASNPLQTLTGGQAASLTAQSVTNNVAAVNPVYVSSVIENASPSRLEMTFNLTLANIVPATSAFTVMVNSSARSVSAVAISGTKVLLTLASPVIYGDAVTVAYTKPASNPLQTLTGGQAASLTAQSVTNNVAAVNPVYVSSVIENASPSRLEMTFNLTLANIVPATSAFTVMVNSSARSVSAVAISGTKVLLTLASPVIYGDAVTVAYTKPASNPLQTLTGGQAASLTAQSVTNNVAAVNPVYVSSVIENASPSRLEMTFNLTLANIVPATSAFTVMVNSSARSVSALAISGTKVLLTLASPVIYGDAVTVAYTKPASNPLQTLTGGQAASLTAQSVTNNVAAVNPVYVSSVIENASPSRLEMTFNLTLANIVPATSAFTVMVNSSARSVSAVAISGTKVLLTLASPVIYGDAVTVAYIKPASNPLQTLTGGQAVSIVAQSVFNNCSLTANQPPVIIITSPTKSITFVAPATFTIEATASDPDGSISKVEFFNGSTKIGESFVAPFSFTWKEVPEGIYSMTAIATDNLNAKTISASVEVIVNKSGNTVNQLPIVSINSPNKGKKSRKHDNVVIEAVASDPDGTISMVEFKNGSITLAEITTAPYIYVWEDVDTGTYIITAIAIDNLGATSTSSEVELSVLEFYDANSEIMNLYPNPNDGHFAIDIYSGLPGQNNKITVVSLSGKTVYGNQIVQQETHRELDLSNQTAGTYILIVTSGNNIVATKKFIME